MRKLKEREAGINQCLKGRMKVRVITKVINNRTLEGYVLEVEDENFHPVVYDFVVVVMMMLMLMF